MWRGVAWRGVVQCGVWAIGRRIGREVGGDGSMMGSGRWEMGGCGSWVVARVEVIGEGRLRRGGGLRWVGGWVMGQKAVFGGRSVQNGWAGEGRALGVEGRGLAGAVEGIGDRRGKEGLGGDGRTHSRRNELY